VLREIALPTFDAVVKQDDRGAAAAALAETALAIARHAHAHGNVRRNFSASAWAAGPPAWRCGLMRVQPNRALRATAADFRQIISQFGRTGAGFSRGAVVPADPWSARPLRYDRESARLWTLGPDGTDNGGARAVPEDSGLAGLRDKDGPAIELGAWLGLRE
jgi:hypothetical protein